ncbi:MAG: hypothetical protein Q7U75_14400, partial [Desulfobacterales bacterium]|nr:hypothetical protein [Desulfobacterales bacterium]
MNGGSAEGRLSSYYKLQGLPANPRESLTLKIDLEGTPPPEGAQLFLKTEGNGAQAPMVLKGEVVEGKLVVTIPAAVQKDAVRSAAGNVSGMILWVGMGMNNTDSSDGHFRVYYPSGEYQLAKQIAAFMERNYALIGNMGLDWKKRNTWPMDVYLFSYSSWSSYILGGSGTAEGNTESDLWGNEGVGLCLNLDTIKQGNTYFLDDVEVTSGHELLHIMQTLYDTRGRLRKTFTHSSWLWLMEASATWLEKSISANADYRPLNAVDNWDFLFKNGLEVPAGYSGGAAVRAHGYGASAFLQYLAPASPGAAPDSIGRVIAKLGVEDSADIVLSSPAYAPVPTLRGEFGADHGHGLLEGDVL